MYNTYTYACMYMLHEDAHTLVSIRVYEARSGYEAVYICACTCTRTRVPESVSE